MEKNACVPKVVPANANVPVILVGNKVDLGNREVDREECVEICQEKKRIYMETSALTGENVEELFKVAAVVSVAK